MQCRISNRIVGPLLAMALCSAAQAGINEATKAYLLGDYEKAHYEALVGATDGDPAAQMLLGQLYFNGEGVDKDLAMSLYWYERAASQGFSDAQYRLGSLYFEGKYDIPKDYDKAYLWLGKALENGNQDAKPKLEGLYKTESGKVVNLQESLDILQQVAATGNMQARYLLSEKLLKGVGLDQDREKAVAMITEDAKQGFVKAQKRLGELYYYGEAIAQDYFEAYAWSMAYAGTKELGGLIREGKQIARSALRKLPDDRHQDAYVKSQQYFEQYVLPFHKNAREVGPDKYRIVVRSRQAQLRQAQVQEKQLEKQQAKPAKTEPSTTPAANPADTVAKTPAAVSGNDATKTMAQSADGTQSPPVIKQSTNQAAPADSANNRSAPVSRDATQTNQAIDIQSTGVMVTPPVSVVSPTAPADVATSSEAPKADTPAVEMPDAGSESKDNAVGADDGALQKTPLADAGKDQGAQKRHYRDVYNVLVRTKSEVYSLFMNYFQQGRARSGRVVFDITISPAGQISDIEMVSSEVSSADLEEELREYLKTIDFGKKPNAEPFKISYPLDFIP